MYGRMGCRSPTDVKSDYKCIIYTTIYIYIAFFFLPHNYNSGFAILSWCLPSRIMGLLSGILFYFIYIKYVREKIYIILALCSAVCAHRLFCPYAITTAGSLFFFFLHKHRQQIYSLSHCTNIMCVDIY